MIVTLDHNCIVALENQEPEAGTLQSLTTMCREHRITFAVYGWMQLENVERGTEYTHRPSLKVRLQAIDLGHAVTMERKPFCDEEQGSLILDPAFDSWALQRIHNILFPNISFDFQEYILKKCSQRNIAKSNLDKQSLYELERNWNNAKSDSLSLSAALSWGPGIFVTNDGNFHKKSRQESLCRLAPHVKILRPYPALVELEKYVSTLEDVEQKDLRAA